MKSNTKQCLTAHHANTILDSIAEGVFTVNEQMKITYFNKAAEKITGVPREEAIGNYCFEVLRSNICEQHCALKNTFRTSEQVIDQHANLLRPNGKQIPISVSTALLKDNGGNVSGGVGTFRDLSTIEELRKEIKRRYTFQDIISKNHKILEVFDILPNISKSESTVLILGPSGSGKELFAHAIHNLSLRNKGPFIAINCGALPDTLLESELFGYEKGAFTDAKKDKPGRFALAKGGTIFLDEVESLSPATQVKLLRVLQEREFEPLGAIKSVKADVRIVSATKIDLAELVAENKFRDDLYFRLNVVQLNLPPLTARKDDLPLLIAHFIEKFNHKMSRNITGVSQDVLETLMRYDFPGNIRQLENIIEHAFVMCRGDVIQCHHLPGDILQATLTTCKQAEPQQPLATIEARMILLTLKKNNGNKIAAAYELGLHRTTLWRKMKKYNLL